MLNWFSHFEMSWMENVACSLIVSVFLGSIIVLSCMLLSSLIKSLVVKYWLVLTGQLSFLVVFIMCLVSFYSGVIAPSDLENEILLNEVVPTEFGDLNENVSVEDNAMLAELNVNNEVTLPSSPKQLVSTETISLKEEIVEINQAQQQVPQPSQDQGHSIANPNGALAIDVIIHKVLEFSNVIVWLWCVGLFIMITRWCLGAYGLIILKRSGQQAPKEVNAVFMELKQRYAKGLSLIHI